MSSRSAKTLHITTGDLSELLWSDYSELRIASRLGKLVAFKDGQMTTVFRSCLRDPIATEGDVPVAVAWNRDHHPVGWAVLPKCTNRFPYFPARSRSTHRRLMLFIRRDYRRLGLGRVLAKRVLRRAPKVMPVYCFPWNAASLQFFKRFRNLTIVPPGKR